MPRFNGDPRWLKARFDSDCSNSECPGIGKIRKGEQAFYFPRTRKTFCHHDECGGKESRDFDASAQDETMFGGGY